MGSSHITTALFVTRAKNMHSDTYEYPDPYVTTRNKIRIICKTHGEFFQLPQSHLRGQKCPSCALQSRTKHHNQFVVDANKKHNNKYQYITPYIGHRHPITAICKEHGEFTQKANDHLNGSGCPRCASNTLLTHNQFVVRARTIHTTKYEYNDYYKGNKTKIVIMCNIHNQEFHQRPNDHLSGLGCPACSKRVRLTHEQFVERANVVHHNKFSYSDTYTNTKTKISILCPIHGAFMQRPEKHLGGDGCRKCAVEKMKTISKGGYSNDFFRLHPESKSKEAVLYLIHLTKNNNDFVKIGITTDLQKRLTGFKGFTKQPIFTKQTTLYSAFCLEQSILTKMKHHKYFPTEQFGGCTECFKNKPEVISEICNIMENNNVNF